MQTVVLASLEKDLIGLIVRSKGYELIGFLDKNPKSCDSRFPYLGDDEAWLQLKSAHPHLQVVLGVDPPKLKEKLASFFGIEHLATLIGNQAIIDESAVLGKGVIIQEGCLISRDARIGLGSKINMRAMVHHDVEVGSFCTIAPAAQLLGKVKIGNRCFIGAGAIILPHTEIGDDVIIGAGAVVTKNIPSNLTICGIPARPLYSNHHGKHDVQTIHSDPCAK